MKRLIPTIQIDKEAEDFVADPELTCYDLSGGRVVRFEPRPKDETVSPRLPEALPTVVRQQARQAGMPYQRYIRTALERAIEDHTKRRNSTNQ
jgi:predicted DNA binding CopG/RHH family protein